MKGQRRILLVGYGAVAQCTLPILFKHLQVPAASITVLDFEARGEKLAEWTAQGVRFVRERVTPDNLATLLAQHVGPDDLLIDLAWNIDAGAILQWCHDHGVLYINTSTELWDPYAAGKNRHPTERTLYWRHMNLRRLLASWETKGPTAVIEHGANPGLISHFVKQGLLDIAERLLADRKLKPGAGERLAELRGSRQFNELAHALGVKVIHCSERDTQITNQPKQVGEFVNTWSIEGFREEGTTTAEMGWGTHEKKLPKQAFRHRAGPRNQICLARMGINTWVRSWVPDFSILGMVVRHGEAFTLSDTLTVREGTRAVYRPTLHYAYCPCDDAIASLNELRGANYQLTDRQRILSDEIISGADILGALLMGHAYTSWWIGSALSIEESRRLVPHQNATTVQVAIAVVAAVLWMLEHPAEGVRVPDELPHDFILGVAKPYLGRWISKPSYWTPLVGRDRTFDAYNTPDLDRRDPWQFRNFLVTEAG